MTRLKDKVFIVALMLVMLGMSFNGIGCGYSSGSTPRGAVVGRGGRYDYSPSVIQSGDMQQFWWCGQAPHPTPQISDTILYESINLSTHSTYGPVVALEETPGAWDSGFVCNPKVIRGTFSNPLGDGQTYTYAMYYVGTTSGVNNSIGVAFSDDGILWKKYPQPVILSTSQTGYGVAQPALYNSDHKSGIWIFYEDNTPIIHHVEATSTDGIHFAVQGTLTTNGLDANNPQASWGDMAYDSLAKYWYAAFNLPLRASSTTGDITERGQYGLVLYRIPEASLLTGATSWQQLKTIDTNLTGSEVNFIPGLLRDMYGDVNIGPYPTIRIYTSISNPQPAWNASPSAAGLSADPKNWDISSAEWVPNSPLLAFNRYRNGSVHETTTGWIDPNGGFRLEYSLGHLYESPQQGATVAFYSCKDGSKDYFVSLDNACEGKRILGINGYGYSQPVSGKKLVALYRCFSGYDHFVSTDPACEGQIVEQSLGYILP